MVTASEYRLLCQYAMPYPNSQTSEPYQLQIMSGLLLRVHQSTCHWQMGTVRFKLSFIVIVFVTRIVQALCYKQFMSYPERLWPCSIFDPSLINQAGLASHCC